MKTPMQIAEAVREAAAKTIELYDDATMRSADYMLSADECAEIIRALDLSAIVGEDKDALSQQQAVQPASEQNARFAIESAIEYGKQGINKPPSDDHWLMPYWEIGRQLAAVQPTVNELRLKMRGDILEGDLHLAKQEIAKLKDAQPTGEWNAAIEAAVTHFNRFHREMWTSTIVNELESLKRPQSEVSEQAEEPGDLDPAVARQHAQTCRQFLLGFAGQSFAGLAVDPDRANLGMALDHLEEAAAMILNLADRVAAKPHAARYAAVPAAWAISTEIENVRKVGGPAKMWLQPADYTDVALYAAPSQILAAEQEAQTIDVNTLESLNAAQGSMEDFAEAADLVNRVTSAQTNGEALGEVLKYRQKVRLSALSSAQGDQAAEQNAQSVQEPTIKYVPINTEKDYERHPNDKTEADADCSNRLDEMGDDRGQGLAPYWKWGFRTGWREAKKFYAALSPSQSERNKGDAQSEYDKLRAAFHVTMLRLMPEKSHAEISAEIDRVAALSSAQSEPTIKASELSTCRHCGFRVKLNEAPQPEESSEQGAARAAQGDAK